MSSYVRYKDIPKDERRRLAAEVRRSDIRVRVISIAAVVFSILVAGTTADRLAPKSTAPWMHLLYGTVFAGAMAAIFWGVLGVPLLRRAVEKKKNSS